MRIFRVMAGAFEGEYPIYESREEFKEKLPDVEVLKWNDCDFTRIEKGVWIEALDGYILQALRVTPNTKGGMAVRVCNGSFTIARHFVKSKGEWNTYWQKFYGMLARTDPYSYSGIMPQEALRGERYKEMTLTFARLIVNGVEPMYAYRQAGFKSSKELSTRFKATELLLREDVMNEIAKHKESFIQSFNEDERFSDETMKDYVGEFMRHVRKGSQTHLNSIFPLLTLLGKLPKELQKIDGKTKTKNIVEAEYNEIPPPTNSDLN